MNNNKLKLGIYVKLIALGVITLFSTEIVRADGHISDELLNAASGVLKSSACVNCHTEDGREALKVENSLLYDFALETGLVSILDFDRYTVEQDIDTDDSFGLTTQLINCEEFSNSTLLKRVAANGTSRMMPPLKSGATEISHSEFRTLVQLGASLCAEEGLEVDTSLVNAIVSDHAASGTDDREVAEVAVDPSSANESSLKTQALSVLNENCADCHGGGAGRERGGFSSITNVSLLTSPRQKKQYIDVCEAEESLILQYMENGSMPKGGTPLIDSDIGLAQIETVRNWIHSLEVQAPSLIEGRVFQKGEALRVAAVNDVISVKPQDQKYLRYISLANLYNSNASDRSLESYRLAVIKLVNAVSTGPQLILPYEVPNTNGLLFRLDMRDYNWTDGVQWRLIEGIYPYSVEPFQSNSFETLSNLLNTKVPIIRADWFAYTVTRPPLYYDFMLLPETEKELENLLGGSRFSTVENLLNLDVVRAGFGVGESGVSFNSRLIERHDLPNGGIYWKSFDFGGTDTNRNLEETPFGPLAPRELANTRVFDHDGGEIIFSLPNGLHGYYLSDAKGRRLNVGPTDIVHDRTRDDGSIVNGTSCMSCHASGIRVRRDTIRSSLLRASESILSAKERVILEQLHPEPEVLEQVMEQDKNDFIDALAELGLVQKDEKGRDFRNSRGNLVPLAHSETKMELVRALSDVYEYSLSKLAVAAELDLTWEEFLEVSSGTSAARLVNRCSSTERNSFDDEFESLVANLTTDSVLYPTLSDLSGIENYQISEPRVSEKIEQPIVAKILLEKKNYSIDEELRFSVTAAQDCHFLVYTIDGAGRVEVHDPKLEGQFMGEPLLKAGEVRQIPIPGAPGLAKITPPAGPQTIGAVCGKEDLEDLGISSYLLTTPKTLDRTKFAFVLDSMEEAHRVDEVSFNSATIYVNE